MFERFSKYQTIFVTGPHRSGTTIAARMIASDTEHDLVIEDDFFFSNPVQLSAFLHAGYGNQVIQCPFLCHEIHDMGYLYDIDMNKCLVVMMHRWRNDILASEERSPVNFEAVNAGQQRQYHASTEAHASDTKYDAWFDQCRIIPNAVDVSYESLRDHPLWVSDHDRLPFEHEVINPPLPRAFADGFRALSNI